MRRLGMMLAGVSLAAAQPAVAQGSDAPDLLIAISVDQLSSDLYEQYAPLFTAGLKRVNQGTIFINGYQAQMATETCPGHSTILTGSYPARTGIVANAWLDLALERENKLVYCAEDVKAELAEGEAYRVSPVHLLVPTLGERMKARNPASRNVAVAGKDRSAVMMGGHHPDQRWYWGRNGWTSDLDRQVPQSVPAATEAAKAMIATGIPALEYPPYCGAKSAATAVKGSEHVVGAGQLAVPPGDVRAFQTSPAYDGAVLALAAALVREMQLGRQGQTDLLSIGLSATDYVGHSYGSEGGEMCLQLLALDRSLGDFFTTLDGWDVDYAVVLTSDHGALDVPDRLNAKGVSKAQWLDPALSTEQVSIKVAEKLGLNGRLIYGSAPGDVHLNPLIEGKLATRVVREVKKSYSEHPQIEAVFEADEIARLPIPSGDPTNWTLAQRVRASFHPERSGDLIVVAREYVQPIANPGTGYVSTHGSPWDYDRRVPIVFWRPGGMGDVREEGVSTVDILPTLAAQIGLPLDGAEIDGRCIRNVPGIICD
ncbi:alkaline phosphatase family protein [Sphingomicrobium lutaoense]|uniref:Alkaline phosphatase n=1 Tax=Sphingomicrobium lutaoense TaxID=515949 RepID=A0A839YWI8_9SPHN|nr:alkaline phosphatase family protein [Sphingomicrobium lutaoense]MBB3763559.1 putative AlkP superfamily pyrophosphatase or phosphodiesterase [Sphingomicrobium lutaoense]